MNTGGAVQLGRAGVASPEPTVGRIVHPEWMAGGCLIDDPVADRLQRGDPTVGWEGDTRLALYLHRGRRQWELWRLEHDGVYRQAMRLSTEGRRGVDAVGELLIWLVTHDGRRGFRVAEVAMDAQGRVDVEKEKASSERNAEAADRFVHALIVDGVQPRDFWAMGPSKGRRRA